MRLVKPDFSEVKAEAREHVFAVEITIFAKNCSHSPWTVHSDPPLNWINQPNECRSSVQVIPDLSQDFAVAVRR